MDYIIKTAFYKIASTVIKCRITNRIIMPYCHLKSKIPQTKIFIYHISLSKRILILFKENIPNHMSSSIEINLAYFHENYLNSVLCIVVQLIENFRA